MSAREARLDPSGESVVSEKGRGELTTLKSEKGGHQLITKPRRLQRQKGHTHTQELKTNKKYHEEQKRREGWRGEPLFPSLGLPLLWSSTSDPLAV